MISPTFIPPTPILRPRAPATPAQKAPPIISLSTSSPSPSQLPLPDDFPTSPPKQQTSPADRQIFEDLTAEASSSLNALGEQTKQDLENLTTSTATYADNIIAEETAALLAKYNDQQRQILTTVDQQRQVIKTEIDRLHTLSAQPPTPTPGLSKRAMLYSVNAALFATAGVSTIVGAVVKENAADLRTATVYIAIAAVWATLFTRERKKSDNHDNGRSATARHS
eukprot:GFKZ01005094.1.p1 GENE.GFKZ01005094.1~~GFKZ01005094.1.p1  ORF type:complete len:224 (-),score=43.76 GFKZ01005094.1:1429-2100(-)